MATKHQRDHASSAAQPENTQRPAPPWAREEAPDDSDTSADSTDRIVERPDGYHWISEDGRKEFGHFATLAEALADMEGYGAEDEAAAEDSDFDDLDIGAPPDDE